MQFLISQNLGVPHLKQTYCKSYIYGVDFDTYQPLLMHQTSTWITSQRQPTHFFAALSALRWNGTERGATTWNDYASGVFPIFSLGLQDTYQVENLPLNIMRSWFLFASFRWIPAFALVSGNDPVWNKYCRQYRTTLLLLAWFHAILQAGFGSCSLNMFHGRDQSRWFNLIQWLDMVGVRFCDALRCVSPSFLWTGLFLVSFVSRMKAHFSSFCWMPTFLWLMSSNCATMPGDPTA